MDFISFDKKENIQMDRGSNFYATENQLRKKLQVMQQVSFVVFGRTGNQVYFDNHQLLAK